MIAIKDFEMPESCHDCLLTYEYYEGGPVCCAVTNECIDNCWKNKAKHELCPLLEVEIKEK